MDGSGAWIQFTAIYDFWDNYEKEVMWFIGERKWPGFSFWIPEGMKQGEPGSFLAGTPITIEIPDYLLDTFSHWEILQTEGLTIIPSQYGYFANKHNPKTIFYMPNADVSVRPAATKIYQNIAAGINCS